MNRHIKKQLLSIIETLHKAGTAAAGLISKEQQEQLIGILADCQEAAIQIGNKIEETEGEGTKAVSLLEDYYEIIWSCSQEREPEKKKLDILRMQRKLDGVADEIGKIKTRYEAVFFPYKASMWDCMESVWMAAKADKECDVYVVPIPYFEMKEGKVTGCRYEGDALPEYVTVTDFQTYSLEDHQADMAFIHNPFDQYNIVTSVHPDFYSKNLKKYIKRLVYIPYFITGDAVYMTHRDIPCYYTVDFIVVQCEKMIDSFADTIPREKFLPLGNPIADRILRMEEKKPEIPEEWRSMLHNERDFANQKKVMLNTSISAFMKERERFLNKVEYVIRLFEKMEGIILVWRPHPLLHATAETMGKYFSDRLLYLENYFVRNKIGILDHTADIGITVALCDAYLGETASSVVHMFGIAGKPRFYINFIIENQEQFTDRCGTSGKCIVEDREYFILNKYGWLMEENRITGEITPLLYLPGSDLCGGEAVGHIVEAEEQLYIQLEQMKGILVYSLKTARLKKLAGAGISREIYQKIENCREESDNWTLQERKIPDDVLADIRFRKMNRGKIYQVWNEGEDNTIEDYCYYIKTAAQSDRNDLRRIYSRFLNNMDGTCGEKIYQAVKSSVN